MLGKPLARAAAILDGRMMKNKMRYVKITVLRERRQSPTLDAIDASATRATVEEFISVFVKRAQTHSRSASSTFADGGGEKSKDGKKRWK